jgi:hypothetical protein
MRAFSLISLLPFVFILFSIAGIALITLGVRGLPIFSAPRCRRCGYDLRTIHFTSDDVGNCPECGNALSSPDAVTYGRWRRQPKKIVWGVVLVAVPWLVGLTMMFVVRNRMTTAVATGPGALPSQSTSALLAALPANLNAPWHWQELERRLKANQLAPADVDVAFAVLAASLNADRAAGKTRQPLHWCGSFIATALTTKSVSQTKVDALCQAYYGMEPPIKMRDRARTGQAVQLVLNAHEPWDIEGFQRCWALSDIMLDGSTKVSIKQRYNQQDVLAGDALSGTGRDGEFEAALPRDLSPGEHEVVFTYEVGIVPQSATFRGIDGKPGTPDKWPQTVSRWQAVVKRKITITPKDQSPLTIITDPARDPFKSATLTVEEALVRPATGGVELALNWKLKGNVDPAASYQVFVQAGTERIDFGKMVFGSYGGGTMRSMPDRKRLNSLPPDVRSIDVILTPDPARAEEFIEFKEVWGLPLELKDIPLQRFDVEPSK